MANTAVKVNKFRKRRKNKTHLVFDEEKRKDFLTGFHKRKLQRKKKAQEDLKTHLKEERKRLKAEAKVSYKNLVVSHRPIPELENLLAEEYEEDDVTVKVAELSATEIAKQNNWIGVNQPKYESDNEVGESSNGSGQEEKVPGMDLKVKPKKNMDGGKKEFNTQLEIKKLLKKRATKNVQKSKVFQLKNKLERQKQKKKSLQQKRQRIKIHKKSSKRKNKNSFDQ